jgi:hypothetical protein
VLVPGQRHENHQPWYAMGKRATQRRNIDLEIGSRLPQLFFLSGQLTV